MRNQTREGREREVSVGKEREEGDPLVRSSVEMFRSCLLMISCSSSFLLQTSSSLVCLRDQASTLARSPSAHLPLLPTLLPPLFLARSRLTIHEPQPLSSSYTRSPPIYPFAQTPNRNPKKDQFLLSFLPPPCSSSSSTLFSPVRIHSQSIITAPHVPDHPLRMRIRILLFHCAQYKHAFCQLVLPFVHLRASLSFPIDAGLKREKNVRSRGSGSGLV